MFFLERVANEVTVPKKGPVYPRHYLVGLAGGRRGSALHVNAAERLSGTPDQLVNNGRGGPDILDDACALARVVRQGLHIASGPSYWNFGTVAI